MVRPGVGMNQDRARTKVWVRGTANTGVRNNPHLRLQHALCLCIVMGKKPVDSDTPPAEKSSKKSRSQSKSVKAGLLFPVSRINRRMIELHKTTKRVGAGAPVYVTAVIEYFCAELLELAVNRIKAEGKGRTRLTAVDILSALRSDPDLHKATAGLRVMVGDKQKGAADLIICKTDQDVKHRTKMLESPWFDLDADADVDANWKQYVAQANLRSRLG